MRAYIDESVRVGDPAAPGWYVLAAVMVPEERADDVRHTLRGELPPGKLRAHWRDSNDPHRRKFIAGLAGFGLEAVVAVSTPIDRRRQERARRLCLRRLLWQLVHLQHSI